jgi:hypothetical protein
MIIYMQKRILFSLGGAVLGVVAAAPAEDYFKLSPATANLVCALVGLVLGYMVSTLVDVFTAKPEEPSHEQ